MNSRALLHDGDVVLYFEPTQEDRHAAILRANEVARALVERARANAAQPAQPDDDDDEEQPRRFRLVLGVDYETKSDRQRRFYHGIVLPQIADQVVMPDGTRYVAKVWKEYWRKRFLGYRFESYKLPGEKRATPKRVRVSTEDLSVRQYSQLIDRVIDTAVNEFNVVFEFDPIERDGVRYVKKVGRKAPPVGSTA